MTQTNEIHAAQEPLVRYCPGCGSIGAVEAKYRDCCPDGNEARLIPQALAEKCRATFKLAIRSAMADAAANDAAPVAAQPPKLTPNELEALHDFQRTVIMDSCHTLGKPMIKRLASVGALESMGFGKHRLTEYGKWLLERHTTSVIDTAGVATGPP